MKLITNTRYLIFTVNDVIEVHLILDIPMCYSKSKI